MSGDRIPQRQRDAVSSLVAHLEAFPEALGGLLVGSLVTGRMDQLSDVDCIVVANSGRFEALWNARCALHEPDITICWDADDPQSPPGSGAHKWLDANMVLVECLVTQVNSGVRLAPPHKVLTGPEDLASVLPARPPIERSELRGIDETIMRDLDVETAYDMLKSIVRRQRAT